MYLYWRTIDRLAIAGDAKPQFKQQHQYDQTEFCEQIVRNDYKIV